MHWFFKVVLICFATFFLLFFVLFIRPKLLPARKVVNSEKFGVIWQNEYWSGTIKITGDILALPGVSVTIDPGTLILVAIRNDRSNMDLFPWHTKAGVNSGINSVVGVRPGEPFLDEAQKISIRMAKFYALGTKEQPIVFRSDASDKSPYDFNIVSFKTGVVSFVRFSNFRRLEIGGGVIVKDSTFSDIGECAICIGAGSPHILNNVFNGSLRDAIWVDHASPVIVNNLFLPFKGNGIVVKLARLNRIEIVHNEFQLPGQGAVYFISGGEKVGGSLSKNLFAGGDIRLPCDSKLQIFQNYIKTNLSFEKSGNCVGSFNVGLNYWEIADPVKVVTERVIGTEPKFKVIIEEVLPRPPSDVGRREN